MMRRIMTSAGAAVLLIVTASAAQAAATPEEVASLGGDEVTPYGAIRAGNEDGSIPAWTGGLTSSAEAGFPDFQSGGHHPDPFSSDEVMFTINSQNMGQYADVLTEGHKALLLAYPETFFINVYQTRRSAAFPERIYAATKAVAATADLVDSGNGISGAAIGVPFPFPDNGLEAIWNHLLRFRAESADRAIGQAPVTASGAYTMVKFADQYLANYSLPGMTEAQLNNVIIYFMQKVNSPPRLAGQVLLVHETMDQEKEPRRAWLYNPGQRRVRRAPNIAFDNPRTASDGLATSDQLDMYNGSPERYNWTLVGKREMIIPYNSYKLHSGDLKYSDIVKPKHINQELARYEKHRVWVVDAVIKPGSRHVYKRRTFYIDEDSWQIMAVDCYDNRDEIWRVQEGHSINYYDKPTFWTTLELTIDLQSRRYLGIGLNNEESITYRFNAGLEQKNFSIGALQRAGRR